LKEGAWAMCLFNRTKEAKPYMINWSQLDFKDEVSGMSTALATKVYTIKNLWSGKTEGLTGKNRKVTILPEDVILYKLSPKEKNK